MILSVSVQLFRVANNLQKIYTFMIKLLADIQYSNQSGFKDSKRNFGRSRYHKGKTSHRSSPISYIHLYGVLTAYVHILRK